MNAGFVSDVWRMFCDGRFSSLMIKNKTDSNTLLKELLNKSNSAACDLMLTSTPEEQEKCYSTFLDTLQTCYSIPVMEEVLYAELTVLYNYLYTALVCREGNQSTYTDHSWFYAINKTLFRVQKLLATKDTNTLPYVQYSPEECLVVQVEEILPLLAYTTTASARICVTLCLCINLVCIRGLQNGQAMSRVLDRVYSTLENLPQPEDWEGLKSEDGLLLPVQVNHSDVHVVSSQACIELTVLLRSLCLYKTRQWSECHQRVQDVKDSELTIIAKFVSGWSLYRNGEYLESVALLMETLRSPLPLSQRLKARIYNLIAMCFQKLDKIQLALQMYKEALSADFGYLLPLYMTSIMYKKQGNSDMELECLNLLVTAIEMREPSTIVNKRLDLLDLFEEEDTDIPYPKALYSFASRALALHKYEVSAEKYQSLISYLRSWQGDAQAFTCLPPLSEIYQETIQALLKAEKYSECVSMCDTILTASGYHGDNTQTILSDSAISKNSQEQSILFTNNNLDSSISSMSKSFSFGEELHNSSKKRKCSDNLEISTLDKQNNSTTEAVTLKVKAEALLMQGDKDQALSCLDRATECISRQRKLLLQNLSINFDQPSAKRRKLDADRPKDEVDASATSVDIECDIYRLMVQILTSQSRDQEAQHYMCLQQQLQIVSSRINT